ncbi:hypothetical protein ALC62_03434 [Cyphomyrmex costatus]|uniref:Uncharacterized protein n=1 Tax=Cyphomyrmex costatus TaxID=456900 RepID=A0A195CYC5_9HYME|nr:hypothetical protein ALC62_03434 [Cyphomyrmex costatus]
MHHFGRRPRINACTHLESALHPRYPPDPVVSRRGGAGDGVKEREREEGALPRIAVSYSRDNCGLRVRERVLFAGSAVPQDPKSITWLYGTGVRDAAQ